MKIEVKGPIVSDEYAAVYEWLGMTATSPKGVHKKLKEADGKAVTIEINSGGGSVFAASEIYTAFRSYGGKVTGEIVGVAASAASVIAMACERLEMSPTAQMMIHNASTTASGDCYDMQVAAELLQNANETIAAAYKAKSGKSMEELLQMMDKTTWFTAEKAISAGLVDGVMFEEKAEIAAAADTTGLIPIQAAQKILVELARQRKAAAETKEPEQKQMEGDKKMTPEELMKNHKEVYDQIFNAGVAAENARVQKIDDLGAVGFDEIISEAKRDTTATAEMVAMKIVKAHGELSKGFLSNREIDAEELDNIPNVSDTQKGSEEEQKETSNYMAKIIGEGR